jgi:Helix-hairpin-helix motif
MDKLDPTKPVELHVKLIGTDNNFYAPGVYQPGALPTHFLKPEYCKNVSVLTPSPLVGEHLNLEPLPNSQAPIPPVIAKPSGIEKLNINQADINQISKIEGISTAAANKILIDRDTNGAYKDAHDLIARQNLSKLANTIEERFSY